MRLMLFIFSSLIFGSAYGQNNSDSIYYSLNEKFEFYFDQSRLDSAYSIALFVINDCVDKSLEDKIYYPQAIINMGRVYYKAANYDSDILFFNKAAEVIEEQKRSNHSINYSLSYYRGNHFDQIGKYELAEEEFLKAINGFEAINETNNEPYVEAMYALGLIYQNTNRHEESQKLFRKVEPIYLDEYGSNHSYYADVVFNLGNNHLMLREFQNAEHYLKMARVSYLNCCGKEHDYYILTLSLLGTVYHEVGDLTSMKIIYDELIKSLANVNDPNDYLSVYNHVGLSLYTRGYYGTAENYLVKTAEISMSLYGRSSIEYSKSLTNLGLLYKETGDYDLSEKYLTESLEIKKKVDRQDYVPIGQAYVNLGYLYDRMMKYKSALKAFDHAEENFLKSTSNVNRYIAEVEFARGKHYRLNSSYTEAIESYEKALKLFDSENTEDLSDIIKVLNELGGIQKLIGNDDLSLDYYLKALKQVQEAYSASSYQYSNQLNTISDFYLEIGEYRVAEEYLLKANHALINSGMSESLANAAIQNNLGLVNKELGSYERSKKYYEAAIAIYEIRKDTLSKEYSKMIGNLATIYQRLNQFEKAEKLYLKAIDLKTDLGLDETETFATSLLNTGILYKRLGQFSKAEDYLIRAKTILSQSDVEIRTIQNINYTLGLIYTEQNKFEQAEKLLISTLTKVDSLKVFFSLSQLYQKKGDHEKALKNVRLLIEGLKNEYLERIMWLSFEQREAYWEEKRIWLTSITDYLCSLSEEYSKDVLYDICLLVKSTMLESVVEINRLVSQIELPKVSDALLELRDKKKEYSSLLSTNNNYRQELLRSQIDSLDKQLVNSVNDYSELKISFESNWEDVKLELKNDQVAIEFIRFYDVEDSLYRYGALLIKVDFDHPIFVDLVSESVLLKYDFKYDNVPIRELLWDPLEEYLQASNEVYISPDGYLNNISFNTLCYESSSKSAVSDSIKHKDSELMRLTSDVSYCESYLLDKYSIYQVTSTRDIKNVAVNNFSIIKPSIHLYGGIDYNAIPNISEIGELDNFNISDEGFPFLLQRNSRGHKFNYLRGAKKEVNNIAEIAEMNSWTVSLYMDSQATENVFDKNDHEESPTIIHLSTHGFAFPSITEGEDSSKFQYSEKPLVRCGLILSGANNTWLGNADAMYIATGEDGVLTAAEVAAMDLQNTKLVVLSACETGVGKIEGFEGVYGLNRGFKLAGVDHLIVSLWEVPDKETMELMTLFYNHLVTTGEPNTSFRNAQKEMRKLYPTQPELWGGFVFIQ